MTPRRLAMLFPSPFAFMALCILLFAGALPAWSQVESGRVVGTVHDPPAPPFRMRA
jgi:hypothetical protein